ncbi:unnamed protein product [Brassica oleracea var. botrytis]
MLRKRFQNLSSATTYTASAVSKQSSSHSTFARNVQARDAFVATICKSLCFFL